MAIVSSTYTIDAHTQRDGSRYVRSTHRDDTGREHSRNFSISAKQDERDVQAIVAQHVVSIDAQLIASAAERAEQEALADKHAAALDEAVKAGTMSKEEATKLGVDLDARSKR